MITITRTFEWDMGHRVTNHESLCKNPHGHRYKLNVQVTGPVNDKQNDAGQGMVFDFGKLKKLIAEHIVDKLDHSFMYWKQDTDMEKFAHTNGGLKLISVPFVPTAECIVAYLADEIQGAFATMMQDITLVRLELNETPNCTAIWEK